MPASAFNVLVVIVLAPEMVCVVFVVTNEPALIVLFNVFKFTNWLPVVALVEHSRNYLKVLIPPMVSLFTKSTYVASVKFLFTNSSPKVGTTED